MLLILKPLILYIFLFVSIMLLFKANIALLKSLMYKSSDVFQYKIHNVFLSVIFVSSYIGIVIILLFIMRIYHLLPRSIQLNTLFTNLTQVKTLWFNMIGGYDYLLQIYLLLVAILLLALGSFTVMKGHKCAHKEIHKLFLYFVGHPFIYNTWTYINIQNHFVSISLFTDIFRYLLMKCASYLQTLFYGEEYNYAKLPYYNLYKFICICDMKGYYNAIMTISPLLVILYNCIFNNFIIIHVFYVPLKLFKRITDCISTNASYVTKWLYELYYKDEDCLYAASPTLRAILDNFILSGVIQNFTLGVQCQAELVVCALTRFELADKNGPLDETYVNEDSEFLHTNDRVHYYHVIPDETGTPIHGTEWILILDKTKHLNMNNTT